MASRARTHPRIPYQYCAHQPHTHAHTRSVTYICPEDDLPQNNTNGRGGKNGDLGPKPTSLSTEGTFYLRACCARVARVVTFKRYAFPKTARAAPIGQIPFAVLLVIHLSPQAVQNTMRTFDVGPPTGPILLTGCCLEACKTPSARSTVLLTWHLRRVYNTCVECGPAH